jgi:8-amino-7-oxononanoate synthase
MRAESLIVRGFGLRSKRLETLVPDEIDPRSPFFLGRREGPYLEIGGKRLVIFCSNDYLGLSHHPGVRGAVLEALEAFGAGSGGAPSTSGFTRLHHELSEAIAEFKHRESALIFSSGYLANLGALFALGDRDTLFFCDRLNHPSLLDGVKLAKGDHKMYEHLDLDHLESLLRDLKGYKTRIIVTDSVFSIDGDVAPLPEIVELAKKYKALTFFDEAHATGTVGEKGGGIEDLFDVRGSVDLLSGTFSKALGSQGGFVAASSSTISYLDRRCRHYLYSTSLSPLCCAAALESLRILNAQPELVATMRSNFDFVRENLRRLGLSLPERPAPILPLIIGDTDKTKRLARRLYDRGIFIAPLTPPNVREGESRLRVTTMATHTGSDLETLIEALGEMLGDLRY